MAHVPLMSVPVKGHAARAFWASANVYVASFPGTPRGAQSSKFWPRPLICGGAQDAPQQRLRLHSQPFAVFPSQVANPELHAILHMLPLHTPEALAGLGQTVPHAPQLVASVVTFTSHPSAPFRLQSRRFVPHAVHMLFEQDCEMVHDMLQPPQLVPLVVVLISHPLAELMSQSAWPIGQASTHAPAAQSLPIGHGMLQPPQCEFEVAVFVSQPFVWFPSQLPKFVSHAVNVQVPVEHDSLALAKSQLTPHPPQLVSVVVDVSQPLFALPSQLEKPMLHMGEQLPPLHVVVP
jgi:hypothetical protein